MIKEKIDGTTTEEVNRLTQKWVGELKEGEQIVSPLSVGRLHYSWIAEAAADVPASYLKHRDREGRS